MEKKEERKGRKKRGKRRGEEREERRGGEADWRGVKITLGSRKDEGEEENKR